MISGQVTVSLWEIIASIDKAKERQQWSLRFRWHLKISPEGCLPRGWNPDEDWSETGPRKQDCRGDSAQLGSLRQALSDKDEDLIGKSEDGTVRIERRLEVNDDKDYREQNTAFLSEQCQEYETRSLNWHSRPGAEKRTGTQVRTELSSTSMPLAPEPDDCIPSFLSNSSFNKKRCDPPSVKPTKMAGKSVSRHLKPSQTKEIIHFNRSYWFFFGMSSFAAQLSEQWSEKQN